MKALIVGAAYYPVGHINQVQAPRGCTDKHTAPCWSPLQTAPPKKRDHTRIVLADDESSRLWCLL